MAQMIVPPEKAEQIDHIFEGLVGIGCQLVMSSGGIRDGIALKRVLKKNSVEAQQFCLAAGVLVSEGWLSIVVVQGKLAGFIRKFPKTAVSTSKENLLQFPTRAAV